MIHFNSAWEMRQRKLWTRNNAQLWLRPDHARFLPPELKAGFNPDQQRIPAGEEGAGQWTGDGSLSGYEPSETQAIDEAGAASRAQGHHYVPRSVFSNLPFKDDTREVFRTATTGRLRSEPHGWSTNHAAYNEAVREQLSNYMTENGIVPEAMTPDQAKEFVVRIMRSSDPRIRDFNRNILRRELNFLLRFGPRRPE